MTAHTPGPWKYGELSGDVMAGIDTVCAMPAPEAETSLEQEIRANARLIAAAPEMLDALLVARDQIREFLPTALGEALTTIEAAIAKARGR